MGRKDAAVRISPQTLRVLERSTRSDFSGVTHWLIRQAAHRAPEALASRLEEEWLADLESRSATLSRLRFAVSCCWAGLVIGNEFPRSRVVVASSAMAPASGFVTLVDRNVGYFPFAPRHYS